MNRRHLLVTAFGFAVFSVVWLAGCTTGIAPAASPTPGAKASAPVAQAPAPEQAKPSAPSASGASSAAQPAAKPSAVLEIVPVAANKADPNVIAGTLKGSPTAVPIYMGTTGLPNVSVGVAVTLQGSAADPTAPVKGYKWTLTPPSDSKAKLTKQDSETTKFTPDVAGIYKVDLVVSNDAGASPSASVQIHAGSYIGMEKGSCATCHPALSGEWAETGHAEILTREINGGADPKNSHYAERCITCHTTGYYQGVSNGGFADQQQATGWQFPTLQEIQSGKKQWESAPAALKNVGNIQCESCHGPATDHAAGQSIMASSLDEGVCNSCHNGGGHHVKGALLANAKHADASSRSWSYPTGPDRQDCVRCHSGSGFISFVENPTEKAAWDNNAHTVTCAVCHDPHSEANPDQLRIVGKPVEVPGVSKDYGLSAVCTECHNARTQPQDALKASFPHYSTAAELLADTGGVDYGQKVPNSMHGRLVGVAPILDPSDPEGKATLFGGQAPGACVACHMWPTPADKDPNQFKVGDHSFNMVSPDGGFKYTASCQSCHAGVKDFNFAAKADYDGNGKTETVQAEVAGLLEVLRKAIGSSGVKPVDGHPYFDRADVAKANDKQKNAIYNYLFVRGLEGSDGESAAIHNFKRAVALLQLSYRDLTGSDVPSATLMK